MEPLIRSTKTVITEMKFFPLSRHPNALWFEKWVGDKMTQQGAVPRATVEAMPSYKLVDFYETHTNPGDLPRGSREASLPENATFWPVLWSKLTDPDAELFPEDRGSVTRENAESPDYVLLNKSGWDHQVWGVDRKPIMAPLRLEIWGSQFHLRRLGEHLTTVHSKHFSNFEVEPNRCWQNHEISGRSHGHVTFDPTGFDFPKGTSRSISSCEDAFFRLPGHCRKDLTEEVGYDPFGVKAFRTGRE